MNIFKTGLFIGAFMAAIGSQAFAQNREFLDSSPYEQEQMKQEVQAAKEKNEVICHVDQKTIKTNAIDDNSMPKRHLQRRSDYI